MDTSAIVFHVVSSITASAVIYIAKELRHWKKSLATKTFVKETVDALQAEMTRTVASKEFVKATMDESNEIQLQKINGAYVRRSEVERLLSLRLKRPSHGPISHE